MDWRGGCDEGDMSFGPSCPMACSDRRADRQTTIETLANDAMISHTSRGHSRYSCTNAAPYRRAYRRHSYRIERYCMLSSTSNSTCLDSPATRTSVAPAAAAAAWPLPVPLPLPVGLLAGAAAPVPSTLPPASICSSCSIRANDALRDLRHASGLNTPPQLPPLPSSLMISLRLSPLAAPPRAAEPSSLQEALATPCGVDSHVSTASSKHTWCTCTAVPAGQVHLRHAFHASSGVGQACIPSSCLVPPHRNGKILLHTGNSYRKKDPSSHEEGQQQDPSLHEEDPAGQAFSTRGVAAVLIPPTLMACPHAQPAQNAAAIRLPQGTPGATNRAPFPPLPPPPRPHGTASHMGQV
eukprot:366095-Chlamydomonas_euryale.AAC.24